MGVEIFVNVYNLSQRQIPYFGAYHSGVEILGVEYSFASGVGVYEGIPKRAPDGSFKCSIAMGPTELTTNQIRSAIDSLRSSFSGDAYSLVYKNCNHFSDALCIKILKKGIPAYVNRLANWGKKVPCLIPPSLLANDSEVAPSVPINRNTVVLYQGQGNRLVDSNNTTPSQLTLQEQRAKRLEALESRTVNNSH